MNGMAWKWLKKLEKAGIGWKCMELGDKKWPEMAEYVWILLKMARTGWEWLEKEEMT